MVTSFDQGYCQSTLLRQYSWVRHGFSTRSLGDMTSVKSRQRFLNLMNIEASSLTMCEQVHGNNVHKISDPVVSHIDAADGLIVQDNHKRVRPVALAIRVADCVPLLFVDTKTKTIAAAHAGWRGTLGHIAVKTVQEMKKVGSQACDIIVALGPHIGMCCYDVPLKRARMFQDVFGEDDRLVNKVNHTWHLNLVFANVSDLIGEGVTKEHIDVSNFCTSCLVDQFFSYRKDTTESFGEIMGIIALT